MTMKLFMNILFSALIFCIFYYKCAKGQTDTDATTNIDPDELLNKYGYLDDLKQGQHHSEFTRSAAIREFQRFNGLEQTGLLDTATFNKMRQPRCGLPDVIKPSDRVATDHDHDHNGDRQHDSTQPLAFYAPGYKWNKNDLTYKIIGYTRQLGGDVQKRAFRNAFMKWSAETPLNFREVRGGTADIEIDFQRYVHGDGAGNSFDGRGGTLAHAFFPGDQPINGDTHFDSDEQWTMGSTDGSNLEIVAAHEFGHALGLGHSSEPTALMAPYYQGYDPNYKLHYDDKRGIQSLYGSRPRASPGDRTRPRPTARPRPTRRPTVTATGRFCGLKFDDITIAADGHTYAFKGSKIYRLDRYGVASGYPKRTRKLYRRSPKSPSAVVYDRRQRKLYMFKGSRFWRYTGYTLDRGYPKTMPRAFRGIKTALQYSDGRIYLFKFRTYFEWSERMRTSRERQITQNWSRLKPGMEASFKDVDNTIYFFKGKKYWKYDIDYRYVEPGYPKVTARAWLGCSPRIPR